MRYVSEQFKEKQNQLIRPALKMCFSIAEDLNLRLAVYGEENFSDMDSTVAPVKSPSACGSDYYYAVVGDGIGVDDSNRMCAPDNSGVIATPTHLVPFGVSRVAAVGEEIMVGSDNRNYYIYMGNAPVIMCFKGGLIPEQIKVEKYNTGTSSWELNGTISNPDLNEIVRYDFATYPSMGYYRLKLLNTTSGGRYQVNWFYASVARLNNVRKVDFENNRISSVSISEETDLTSQALPTYEMTVTCLDVNGEYKPETDYWNTEFCGGQPCYLRVGYDTGNEIEYVQMFFGSLSKEPTYANGKITFYVSIPMALSEGVNTSGSYVNGRLYNDVPPYNASGNPGDLLESRKFVNAYSAKLFDDFNDIFIDSTDEDNSVYNHYASIPFANARQLAANALGGYIMAGFGTINVFKTCNAQYKSPVDYLTRYEQEKATLESQPKVGSIKIVRNENTLSSNYVDVEATERITVTQNAFVTPSFIIPSWEYGKIVLVDMQPGSSSATFTQTWTVGSSVQSVRADGSIEYKGYRVRCTNMTTTIKPILRFYAVDNKKYEENESANKSGTETYTNENEYITNSYTAAKAKQVARFMSDVSNQYEVDVVQDLRYELGDVIRLETEKNVFKTCIITALKFNLPGSKGHVTCRKIFSLMDSEYAVPDPQGSIYANFPTGGDYYVGKNDGVAIFGTFKYNNRYYFYGLGFSTYTKTPGGTEYAVNKKLVDLNGHEWGIFFYNVDSSYTTNNPYVIELPDYDPTSGANANSWGAIELIKALYNEQNMTPPVDYTCTLENV